MTHARASLSTAPANAALKITIHKGAVRSNHSHWTGVESVFCTMSAPNATAINAAMTGPTIDRFVDSAATASSVMTSPRLISDQTRRGAEPEQCSFWAASVNDNPGV